MTTKNLEEEKKHFLKCKKCGELIDMRDLKAVFDHENKHGNNFPVLTKKYKGERLCMEE